MASRTYIQLYADGTQKKFVRRKQGRKPSGLGKSKLVRLWQVDEEKMKILKDKYGVYWNENEFIRSAVSEKLLNSIYTESVKS